MCVEMGRLVKTFPTDMTTERFLSGVNAVVSLQHADCSEALPTHSAAVRFLLGVPAHVNLQLTGKAKALPTLLTAVPPLDALAGEGGARQRRPQRPHVLYLQEVCVLFSIGAK